jgi:hypothetical protein
LADHIAHAVLCVFYLTHHQRILFMDKKYIDKMKGLPLDDDPAETETDLKI